jgi:hypothetical protein
MSVHTRSFLPAGASTRYAALQRARTAPESRARHIACREVLPRSDKSGQIRTAQKSFINLEGTTMNAIIKNPEQKRNILESGKIGWAILWLLGVPLPLLLIIYLIWGR